MKTTSRIAAHTRDRSRRIIAVVLAVVAVGGIGAAATSAAWTDNVFASAQTKAATFDLQGSLDGKTWVQSDNKDSISLPLDASKFADMLPGQTRTATFQVKNTGSTSAALGVTSAWADSTFNAAPAVTTTAADTTLTTQNPDTTITVTVTTPDNWADTNKGKSGSLVVTVAGEAVAGH